MAALLLTAATMAAAAGCRMAATGENIEGVRLFQQAQYQQAIQRFQTALTNDPRNADAYYNLAATYHQMGKEQRNSMLLQQAEGLYHQCLDLDKDHADCYRALAVLLVETDRPDKAFTLLQRWGMQSPHLPDPRVELARLYEEFGDDRSAMQHLQDAVVIDPTNARAWAALGRQREKAGDLQQALANYQRSYQLNAFQAGVSERIAQLQRSVGPAYSTQPGTQIVTQPANRGRY